jgi:hypothetical protein
VPDDHQDDRDREDGKGPPVAGPVGEQHPDPLAAYFFFPYFSGDDGSRPLPSTVAGYNCPSLLVNGVPWDWKPLPPGGTIQLSATVTNGGGLGAYAVVQFRWAPWSAQFSQNLAVIGEVGDIWQAGETRTTQAVSWQVPANLPQHVCLLATVDSILDTLPNPEPLTVADHHYAQQNLIFLTVQPGSKKSLQIIAGNPAPKSKAFRMRVRPDLGPTAEAVAASRNLLLNAKAARTMRPALRAERDSASRAEAKGEGHELMLRLPRRSEQRCTLAVDVPESLRPGEAVILVVEQLEAEGRDPVGTAAVVLTVQRY